jgi:hypothetical protein
MVFHSSSWFSNLEVECPNAIPWLFKRPSEQELAAIVMLFFSSFGLLAILSLFYLWLFPVLLGELSTNNCAMNPMLICATLESIKIL